MKLKPANFSSQILILALAALIVGFMIQVAQAQTVASTQNNYTSGPTAQTLETKLPSKSLGKRIRENTTLGYYQQFLGPTAAGSSKQTYNPFVEGQAPLQSFHAFNLRYQINRDWAAGSTLTVSNGYTEEVENKKTGAINTPKTEWFNARLYVSVPSAKFKPGTLFTTVSYEAPTSSLSKEDEMKYGLVLSQSFAFNMPSVAWSAGILGQYYRAFFKNNVKREYVPSIFPGGDPFLSTKDLQTVIVSGGPYLGYRFNDSWMVNSLVTFDWDQKGVQTGTREFNNNLDHRARVSLSYFPAIKYFSSIGLFTQGLLKFRPETTAFGAELALKF